MMNMKKTLALVLIAALMVFLVSAFAEEKTQTGITDTVENTIVMDLDGDGVEDTIELHRVVNEDEGFETVYIKELEYETVYMPEEYFMGAVMFAEDINGDGKVEIFLYGDVASDDYYTYVLHYVNGFFNPLTAPDISRDENTDEYFGFVYGSVIGVGDNTVRFAGSQDAIGTWWMERTLTLKNGRFEIADDGLWKVCDFGDDPWEYQAMTLKQDLTLTAEDGAEVVISAGEKLLLQATDKTAVAYLTTQDGRTGTVSLATDEEKGWGMLVNGIPEEDVFDNVHYAD